MFVVCHHRRDAATAPDRTRHQLLGGGERIRQLGAPTAGAAARPRRGSRHHRSRNRSAGPAPTRPNPPLETPSRWNESPSGPTEVRYQNQGRSRWSAAPRRGPGVVRRTASTRSATSADPPSRCRHRRARAPPRRWSRAQCRWPREIRTTRPDLRRTQDAPLGEATGEAGGRPHRPTGGELDGPIRWRTDRKR